jgi:hypothetical protein
VFGERVAPKRPRVTIVSVTAVAAWWNLSLGIQHSIGWITQNEGVSLGTLVWKQFVGVRWRLPRVVRRYLFDRGWLYESDPARSWAER